MIFFNLFSTAMTAVLCGVIAAAVTMALYYVFFRALDRDVVRSKVFLIASAVLTVLLIVQYSLLSGAVSALGEVDSAEIYLQQVTENAYGTLGVAESQQLLDQVTGQYPLIGVFVGICNFAGQNMSDIAGVMAETMRDFLSSYIWRRVWWILGLIVVASVVIAFMPGTGRKKSGGDITNDDFDTSVGETNDWGM